MARKARQRISYVLPLANSAGGHRLGVNGLAVDEQHALLYSAGRDGVICAWDLNLDLQKPLQSSQPAPDTKPPAPPATTFRQQVQAHTHWVNDIALAQSNEALVSASSDITVKVWRPWAEDYLPPQTIGLHSDYVKVLSVPSPSASWVASGGLDRKICLWDLNGAGQNLGIEIGKEEGGTGPSEDKGSVYALASTHSILASGGPESTVRVWDPKSGKRVTKFVGHTDNIRDILISEDGGTILSASSDQTVKVWSVTAGRCMYTLTMHDSSVWSLSSKHPQLSVFYSSDKSGLVAKTDTRDCADLDDGLSVAVCQENEGVHKLTSAGPYIWTATSRPSINRWIDVDTDGAEIEMPESLRNNRFSISTAKTRMPSISDQPRSPQSPQSPSRASIANGVHGASTNGANSSTKHQLPLKHILRISNTSYLPAAIPREIDNAASASRRRNTIDPTENQLPVLEPFRSQPEFSIEGRNGLIKHAMLNDRKRVLTLDTAGEVLMWDLLKCVPIRSFGNRHLEDVRPEVDTVETVANWCSIDTRTGSLAVSLDENNCFDAEMYADELELDEDIDFKEDQRINLGKWVLRYLFANLITEEIKRDQAYRKYVLNTQQQQRLERANAPSSIQLPINQINPWNGAGAGLSSATSTLRPLNTSLRGAATPGLMIGLASPAPFSPVMTRDNMADVMEDGAPLEKRVSLTSQPRTSIERNTGDYFSTSPRVGESNGVTSPGADGKPPMSPGAGETAEDTKDTPSGKLGKKFRMSFGMKKLTKTTTAPDKEKPAAVVEEKEEVESDSRSTKTSNSRVVDDNFLGCLQKIRFGYEDDVQAQMQRQSARDAAGGVLGEAGDLELQAKIAPSLPNDTPVLKPPPNTVVLIQEDRPEAGGVADLFEGKVDGLGKAADLIEKAAPMWLGEVLLRNQMPIKDIVKISFVLEPMQGPGQLPSIAADGNNRLNANRMLRARKILAYVAERIEPAAPPVPDSASEEDPFADPKPVLRPEDYLELWCHDQMITPKMTLATIRAFVWRGSGDVVLFYRSNGRKKIKHMPDVVQDQEAVLEPSHSQGQGQGQGQGERVPVTV